MPELPEVETIKNAIQHVLHDAIFCGVTVNNPNLRKKVPKNISEILINSQITGFKRIAKYIIILLNNGYALVIHLGMSGTIRLSKDTEPKQKHDHLIFQTSAGYMVYNDPRRFGLCLCEKIDHLPQCSLFKNIGIDPFDDKLDSSYLKNKLECRSSSIKQILLEQKIICGIGNIYASEALFLAGILPTRKASTLSLAECDALLKGIRKTLSQAIFAGGSTLKDYKKPDGSLGYFQNSHCVYRKTGQTCPNCVCNAKITGGIKKIIQNGRSTYFCETKQR